MHPTRTLAAAFALLTLSASAQTTAPVARVFHPAPPLPSYDVATIKPAVNVTNSSGMTLTRGAPIRQYIRDAYAPTLARLALAQVIGGPDWIDKDQFSIDGKPPADLEVAMKKMKTEDQTVQQHMMQQSLLAERFHLKVHFEVREMPVYVLVPAKSGLKIKAVDAPAPRDPNSPPPPLPPPGPNTPVPPGMMVMMMSATGARTVRAGATTMTNLVRMVSGQGDIGDRPVIDQTGFTGNFNIDNLTWASLGSANSSDSPDLPSLGTALEETLGIKLVATKGPVEVVVIDSIDHPTEN